MRVIDRVKAPTPKFFRVLRSIGLALLGISGTIAAAPVVLPTLVVSVAGYMAVTGGILLAISQLTVDDRILREAQHDKMENLNNARDGNE
jgi:energy-converting hydrogenase Eha subunit G